MNTKTTKCLIQKHQKLTVADLTKTTARLREHDHPHRTSNFCGCQDCTEDRRRNCTHLHKCATEALMRLQALTPKTNLLHRGEGHGDLSLTPRRKEQNQIAIEQNGKITFDPTMTSKNDIAECF